MGLNERAIVRILGFVLVLLAAAMLPSLFVSLLYGEYKVAGVFLSIILPTAAIGLMISHFAKAVSTRLKIREGFLVVSFTWFIASILGSLPFLLTGSITNVIDALFESTSAFTTTGASIIENVEALPKGIVFWRSFSQWLGGMGILIFAVSLLPALGISGQHMARAETSGPSLSKMAPRMSDSAKILYLIYFGFTIAATVLLLFGGLNLYDALIAAFGSVAVGGLSNYNVGIAHFDSIYIESIVSFFTILVCLNFGLYYMGLRGKWRDFFADREFRLYFLILGMAVVLITANLWLTKSYDTFAESLRYGVFEVTAFLTTTGHYSTDFNLWPSFSKMILFLLMLIGACSSSVGGGIKVIRVLVLFKLIQRGAFRRLHPRAVVPIKINNKVLPSESMAGIMSFLHLYIIIFVGSVLVLSLENLDLMSTLTATASILNNVGTGFELIGPTGSFELFSGFSKIYLCFLMMMGRLELFTIVLLFSPSFWNPDH
jgi:trk system potassium uptake protein TrkH